VILVAAFLLLVALGLLAGGLAQGSAALQWGCFAASALAALTLAVGELRRRKALAGEEGAAQGATRRSESASAAAPTAPPTAPPPPGAPAVPPAPIAVPETVAEPTGQPAEPSTGAHAGQRGAASSPPTGAHAAAPVPGPDGEPPVEEVEVTDLLLVLDLTDEVLVVDEHPRYHLAGCPLLVGVATIPLPMVEARTDGFTPCGACAPDRHLAGRERARRAG
jgi:hypothetical protein